MRDSSFAGNLLNDTYTGGQAELLGRGGKKKGNVHIKQEHAEKEKTGISFLYRYVIIYSVSFFFLLLSFFHSPNPYRKSRKRKFLLLSLAATAVNFLNRFFFSFRK
jgi:hypothetical protein